MNKVGRPLFEYETTVLNTLVAYGYPREGIVLEGKIDSRRYVDFIITDVITGAAVMVIEIKMCSRKTREAVKQVAFNSLKKCYDSDTENFSLKAVAAIWNRDENKLEFIDFTRAIKENDYGMIVEDYILPTYDVLTLGVKQKEATQQKDKQSRSINTLKILCWIIIPTICLVTLFLDGLGIYVLSSFRLIVLGTGAVVTLIPCFKEIRIGELYFKNQTENQ